MSRKEKRTELGGDYYKTDNFCDGAQLYIEKYFKYMNLHRDTDEPSWIEYDIGHNIVYEEYFKMGKTHRVDKPARIEYDDKGNIKHQYYYTNGVLEDMEVAERRIKLNNRKDILKGWKTEKKQ